MIVHVKQPVSQSKRFWQGPKALSFASSSIIRWVKKLRFKDIRQVWTSLLFCYRTLWASLISFLNSKVVRIGLLNRVREMKSRQTEISAGSLDRGPNSLSRKWKIHHWETWGKYDVYKGRYTSHWIEVPSAKFTHNLEYHGTKACSICPRNLSITDMAHKMQTSSDIFTGRYPASQQLFDWTRKCHCHTDIILPHFDFTIILRKPLRQPFITSLSTQYWVLMIP